MYNEKYAKYKRKYLDLLNQFGGANKGNTGNDEGGGADAEDNTKPNKAPTTIPRVVNKGNLQQNARKILGRALGYNVDKPPEVVPDGTKIVSVEAMGLLLVT